MVLILYHSNSVARRYYTQGKQQTLVLDPQDGDRVKMLTLAPGGSKLTRPNVSDGKLRTSLNIIGLPQVQRVFRVGFGPTVFGRYSL